MEFYYIKKPFRQAKLYVGNAVTLKYFDPLKPIVIECDASGTGIGGTLLQDRSTCYLYFSSINWHTKEILKHWACELLTVVVIIEHLHHYIFRHQFTLHTDHSPLVSLFQKCLNDTSPCLQHGYCLGWANNKWNVRVCYTQVCSSSQLHVTT